MPKHSTCLHLKAAVVRELGRSVMVEEIKVDPPKATEVRIKMLFASICHTDIVCFDGFPTPLFPRIPGHEGVGMVECVGEDIKTKLKPGDIVMPLLLGECGQCLNCKSGRTNLCLAYPLTFSGLMLDGTSRMSIAKTGETIYHHLSCSTWSEYMVIDINYVLKIDPTMHLPYASFLSCGFTTGFGAPWKETQITKGSIVAVFGLGAVGLGGDVFVYFLLNSWWCLARVNSGGRMVRIVVCSWLAWLVPGGAPLVVAVRWDENNAVSKDEIIKVFFLWWVSVPAIKGAQMQGASKIIGVDVNENKAAKGKAFGKTHFINPEDRPNQSVSDMEIELDELLTHEIRLENIHEVFEILKKPDCIKILINFD
ncbi:alcohol dehydrogenase-like 1 protein [Tanacetum coccineum]